MHLNWCILVCLCVTGYYSAETSKSIYNETFFIRTVKCKGPFRLSNCVDYWIFINNVFLFYCVLKGLWILCGYCTHIIIPKRFRYCKEKSVPSTVLSVISWSNYFKALLILFHRKCFQLIFLNRIFAPYLFFVNYKSL